MTALNHNNPTPGVRILGPSRRGYARVRMNNAIEKSIPLKSSDPKIIAQRAAEVRLAAPLIKAGIKVEFSWLNSTIERTTIGGSIDYYFNTFMKAKSIEGLAPKTLAGYRHMYAHLKISLQVGRRADTLKLADFNEFQQYLIKSGLSPATSNRRCREFSVYLGFLYDHEVIRRRFKVKRIKEIEKINYITKNNLKLIISHIPDHLQDIYFLFSQTGMRLSEPFNAALVGDWLIVPPELSKSRRMREIEVSDYCIDIWKKLMKLPHKPQYYSKVFKKAARAAGLGHHKFHDIRHYYAVFTYVRTSDIFLTSRLLGHSSLAVTEKYQKFSLAQLKADFPFEELPF